MSVIRWEDPPPAHRITSAITLAHNLIAVQLKRRPGEWAVVAEGPKTQGGLARSIAIGTYAPYRPPGSFEACQRVTGETIAVYARYVGGES